MDINRGAAQSGGGGIDDGASAQLPLRCAGATIAARQSSTEGGRPGQKLGRAGCPGRPDVRLQFECLLHGVQAH